MKNLILILTLSFCSYTAVAQISPYYPNRPTVEKGTSAGTYTGLNFFMPLVEGYLSRNYFTLENSFYKKETKIFTYTFVQKFAANGNKPAKLHFKLKVFLIDGQFVIESYKITGTELHLLSFFIGYWPTSIQLPEKPTKGYIAKSYFLQDEIVLSYYTSYSIAVKSNLKHTPASFTEWYKGLLVNKESE